MGTLGSAIKGAIEIGICEPPTPETSIRICAWESSERVVTPIAARMVRAMPNARAGMPHELGLASVLRAEGESRATGTTSTRSKNRIV
jgi:hypothetical protein